MATLRTGTFGFYYGSTFNTSALLTDSEMSVNAKYIYFSLSSKGWTINSISAILGNMQAESSINPGRWQSDDVGNYSLGYGLVQWTPVTKYTDWCSGQGFSDPSEMDNNISRIEYERANGGQWYATDSYNLTFDEFATSSESCEYLARAFLLCYERPGDQSESVQEYRGSLARHWFNYLSGEVPDIPIPPTPGANRTKKKGYNFILFNQNRRSKNGINKTRISRLNH